MSNSTFLHSVYKHIYYLGLKLAATVHNMTSKAISHFNVELELKVSETDTVSKTSDTKFMLIQLITQKTSKYAQHKM